MSPSPSLSEGPSDIIESLDRMQALARKGGLQRWNLQEFFTPEEQNIFDEYTRGGSISVPAFLPEKFQAKLRNAHAIIDFYLEAAIINGDRETQKNEKTYDVRQIRNFAEISFREIEAMGRTEMWMVGYGSLMGSDSIRDIGDTEKIPVQIIDHIRDIACVVSSLRNYPWVENGLTPPDTEIGAAGIRHCAGAIVNAVAMKLRPEQLQKIREREWPVYATLPVTTRTLRGEAIAAIACIPAPTAYVIGHMSESERGKYKKVLRGGKVLEAPHPNPQYVGTLIEAFAGDVWELLHNSFVGEIPVGQYLRRRLPRNPKRRRYYKRVDTRSPSEQQEVPGSPRWKLQ